MFSPQDDMSTWRREVANWVDLITAGADNGEDKLYKTVKATLGTQLYNRGLPRAQKSMVDYAQLMKQIDYKQEDQVRCRAKHFRPGCW